MPSAMSVYWERIRKIAEIEGISATEARGRYEHYRAEDFVSLSRTRAEGSNETECDSSVRCLGCHEPLHEGPTNYSVCDVCGVAAHSACYRELGNGRCFTPGCRGQPTLARGRTALQRHVDRRQEAMRIQVVTDVADSDDRRSVVLRTSNNLDLYEKVELTSRLNAFSTDNFVVPVGVLIASTLIATFAFRWGGIIACVVALVAAVCAAYGRYENVHLRIALRAARRRQEGLPADLEFNRGLVHPHDDRRVA